MIPELAGFITRRAGRNFNRMTPALDAPIHSIGGLGGGNFVSNHGSRISLYVHIPFCRSLCSFCCFNRYLFKEELARRYFIDLNKELEMYARQGFNFSSICFGGGTPTVLMDELSTFIENLRSKFDVHEITLETTPRELTQPNIDILKRAGINRLSIGVQTFDEKTLKTMGRISEPADEIKRRLHMAEGQFETLNIDFVFNFPGQTTEQFAADIAAFKELGIDQATFYPLMASPHKKDALERKFNSVDTSREKQFYDIILRELYHDGYTASTVWCFSKGKRMIDEYIVEFDDYIGIGAGSVSSVGGNFYVNSFSLDRYHELTSADRLPIVGWRQPTEQENLRYYLLTKLFGMSLDTEALNRRFSDDGKHKALLERTFLKTFGMVSGNGTLKVTEKGMYTLSVMMRDFFTALNTLREYYIENQI